MVAFNFFFEFHISDSDFLLGLLLINACRVVSSCKKKIKNQRYKEKKENKRTKKFTFFKTILVKSTLFLKKTIPYFSFKMNQFLSEKEKPKKVHSFHLFHGNSHFAPQKNILHFEQKQEKTMQSFCRFFFFTNLNCWITISWQFSFWIFNDKIQKILLAKIISWQFSFWIFKDKIQKNQR